MHWTRYILYILTGCLALPPVSSALSPSRQLKVIEVEGEGFVTLHDLASYYSFSPPDEEARQITLQSKWTEMEFKQDSRILTINGVSVWLQKGIRLVRGHWAVAHIDVVKTIDPVLRPYAHLGEMGYKRIMLDPGHGGEDSGTLGSNGTMEKEITLSMAKQLKPLLEMLGCEVRLTRDTDLFIPLRERARMARAWKADMFISLHLNAVDSRVANGFETYALAIPGYNSTNDPDNGKPNPITQVGNRHDPANMALAYAMQKALAQSTRNDRGMKRARFQVLRECPCPAVLIEAGFLSNTSEEKLFNTAAYQEQVARHMLAGIQDYMRLVNRAQLIERQAAEKKLVLADPPRQTKIPY